MFGKAVQRGNTTWAQPLLLGLVGRQTVERRRSIECAGAAVDDPFDLWHGELAPGGHGGYLALANRIADLQEHGRERQRQITAMEDPLDLVIQLQQNEARSDPSGGRPDASCKLGRG